MDPLNECVLDPDRQARPSARMLFPYRLAARIELQIDITRDIGVVGLAVAHVGGGQLRLEADAVAWFCGRQRHAVVIDERVELPAVFELGRNGHTAIAGSFQRIIQNDRMDELRRPVKLTRGDNGQKIVGGEPRKPAGCGKQEKDKRSEPLPAGQQKQAAQ